MLRFRNDDVKISEIGDLIAEFLQLFVKIGIPQRRRAHIHATPIRAEVHGDTDDGNLWHTIFLFYPEVNTKTQRHKATKERPLK